ncbi:hypothetical protein LSUCC0387_05415 [Rhodobacterales bacterium LSUCC0387]|nr:hypothetical protein [Rhodobacterales bacterium LSUCC0387]
MSSAYIRVILKNFALADAESEKVLSTLDLFIAQNSIIFAFFLRIFLVLATTVILLFGDKISLKIISNIPFINSIHEVMLTVVLMAYFDA